MTASLTSLARPSAPSPVLGREGTHAVGEAVLVNPSPARTPLAKVHAGYRMPPHFHITAEERRACEAEHAVLTARWS